MNKTNGTHGQVTGWGSGGWVTLYGAGVASASNLMSLANALIYSQAKM